MTDTKARWYPAPPPPLEGEGDEYTDRLTGADRTGRSPYDHPRNRQCSIGYHGECTDPQGQQCKCPHHTEQDVPVRLLTPPLQAAANILAGLYDLPEATGRRVIVIAIPFITGQGTVPDRAGLNAAISEAYGSPVTEWFVTDVATVTERTLRIAAGLLLRNGSEPSRVQIEAALEAERNRL